MKQPNYTTIRDSIRASVPDGKLSKARIVLANPEALKGASIGGFTEYDGNNGGRVSRIGAPAGDDSKAITIRGHETRHATRHKGSKKRKPLGEREELAGQIVDDVFIESTQLPRVKGLRAYRRAHLAEAMRGVHTITSVARKVKSGEMADTVNLRNGQLLHSVRVIAMLRHYGGEYIEDRYGDNMNPEYESRKKGYCKVSKALGPKLCKAAGVIAKMAKARTKRASAISALLSLLELEESHLVEEGVEGDGPKMLKEGIEEGTALDGKMAIRDLRPKSVDCSKEKQINRRHAPSGVIINPTRYVNAIISGDANGLFARRVRNKPGGCVLIDASGSMRVDAEVLRELCEAVPLATVAYYSGSDGAARGELVIYAFKGKRFSGKLPGDSIHGGNAVDLPAIKWMMRQAGPWTLVSDLNFCGGKVGSEIVAIALVERAQQRGLLTVHRSIDAAYEAFGGKAKRKEKKK